MYSQTASPLKTTDAVLSLLTFDVAGQIYGLPIKNVVRIIEMVTITQVADAPEFVKGVINVRGKVTPVVDVRLRFGLSPRPYTLHTPIVLAELADQPQTTTQPRMVGLVVDTVLDIQNVESGQIETVEQFMLAMPQTSHSYFSGMVKAGGKMTQILNLNALIPAFQTLTV